MNRRALVTPIAALVLAAAGCGSETPRAQPAAPSASPSAHQHAAQSPAPDAPAGTDPTGQLVVVADDALRAPLTRLATKFEEAYPGSKIGFQFGPAATLARHLPESSTVDLFITADDAAISQVTGERTPIARESLVLAVRAGGSVRRLADLARPKTRVAMCAETARCGAVARRVLAAAKVTVTDAELVADGRAAVARVTAGAADVALVYRADVGSTPLRIFDSAEAAALPDEYKGVALRTGRNPSGAKAFLGMLTSALGRGMLNDAGFGPP